MANSDIPYRATGTVKWFEKTKGYGFIVCDDTQEDMLLHANVLRDFGQKSLASGALVTVMASRTAQGLQVAEILSITPPSGKQTSDATAQATAVNTQPVRVKWYDAARGFGFVEVYGTGVEAFLHVETLSVSGLSEVDEGEALNVVITAGDRGPVVKAIHKWSDPAPSKSDTA